MAVLTTAQRNRLYKMCPVAKALRLDERTKYLDSDGAYNGPTAQVEATLSEWGGGYSDGGTGSTLDTDGGLSMNGAFIQGAFNGSAHAHGVALSATVSAGARFYSDDNNAAIGSGTLARGGVFRTLLTYTGGNREQEVAGVIGQVVSVAGTNRHNMAGTWGSYEARTSLTVDGQAWATDPWIQAAVIGRVGVGTSITTINANGILAGVAAMSNTISFSANNGYYTGLFVGKWSGTVDWAYGLVIDSAAISTNGIYMAGGTAIVGIKLGALSSTTPGTGFTVSDSATRALEVNTDDNDASLSTATLARAIMGRNMVYADASNEMWGVDGLLKWSGVAHTGNVHAGVVGRFESTGTCTTATGSGNTYCAGIMGRVGGGGTFTIGSGTFLCGVLAFYNTSTANAFTNTGTHGFHVAATDIASSGKWDYGLYIEPSGASWAIRVGTLSSTTAGSGITLSDTVTRAVEVHADDNDTARSTGTQGRAIMGRTMIYANNACEDWGVHGLSKVSAVTKSGNVSAGVVGAFEMTGTCQVSTGSGNSFVAGVMGRVGTAGSVTLDTGTYAACVLAFGNNANTNAFTGTGYCGFLATVTDIGTAETFDYGLLIDTSCAVTGIQINTTSGAAIDFPSGNTYAAVMRVGTFTTPVAFGDDEMIEIHARLDADAKVKPAMRVRCSTPDGVAMTTGEAHAIQAQGYNTSTSDAAVLEAIQGHVGIKANCEIIADVGTMPNMRAGWFKIEDLGFDLTLTGDAASLCLGFQFNSGTTLTGNADWMFLAKEGSLTDPADAFVRVYDGAGGGWATNLFDIPASLPYDAANSSGSQSGKIALKVGGQTKYIQCYSD